MSQQQHERQQEESRKDTESSNEGNLEAHGTDNTEVTLLLSGCGDSDE
jgi:hypothetical protein